MDRKACDEGGGKLAQKKFPYELYGVKTAKKKELDMKHLMRELKTGYLALGRENREIAEEWDLVSRERE